MKIRSAIVGLLLIPMVGCYKPNYKAMPSPAGPVVISPNQLPRQAGRPSLDQIFSENEIKPGRYAIFHSPHIERDTMLLDTATGDSWVLTEAYKDGPLFWQLMPRKGAPNNEQPTAPKADAPPAPDLTPYMKR